MPSIIFLISYLITIQFPGGYYKFNLIQGYSDIF